MHSREPALLSHKLQEEALNHFSATSNSKGFIDREHTLAEGLLSNPTCEQASSHIALYRAVEGCHLDEDALGGGHARADHDGGGRRKAQRAGAGNDEDGDAEEQREQEVVVPRRQPLGGVPALRARQVPVQLPQVMRSVRTLTQYVMLQPLAADNPGGKLNTRCLSEVTCRCLGPKHSTSWCCLKDTGRAQSSCAEAQQLHMSHRSCHIDHLRSTPSKARGRVHMQRALHAHQQQVVMAASTTTTGTKMEET